MAGLSATSASNEEPRAKLLLGGDGSGSGLHGGGTLALILAALVTGILVGAMAVVRFRSPGVDRPAGGPDESSRGGAAPPA